MTEAASGQLRNLVGRLEALADRRLAARPRSASASARATQLRDHLRGHVRVRADSLDAPLLVLILGPTGAGKSTLFNTLAGRAASTTGVLRPTTRVAVVLTNPGDREALLDGTLVSVGADRLQLVEDDTIPPGVALVDAPDIDSIEHSNRELADHLVESADLCLFVTTAIRYADRVPWTVLGRVRERGLPLIVVINRMPTDEADRREILTDAERLFADAGWIGTTASGPNARIQLVGVNEGDIEPATESLRHAAIAPIADRVRQLRRDRAARMELAARALAGSLAGLGQLLDTIADDCEHEAINVDALLRTANHQYERELISLRDELGRGTFLREEALRHWQRFVGADQITRFFSQGIGRVRGAISAMLRPAHAPVEEVRAATTEDLLAVARSHAAEAARRTATSWAEDATVATAIADDPGTWSTSIDFDDRLRGRLDAWIDGIAAEIRTTGRPRQRIAQGASIGVNVVGTGVVLGTFIHTGGLTGAEVGVAAATAFLNQRLLSALFGEAAMAELIAHARNRLDEALAATFAEELARFARLVPGSGQVTGLAADLRQAGDEMRNLPGGLPADLHTVLAAGTPAAIPGDDEPRPQGDGSP